MFCITTFAARSMSTLGDAMATSWDAMVVLVLFFRETGVV
jgi:hypothetical protein